MVDKREDRLIITPGRHPESKSNFPRRYVLKKLDVDAKSKREARMRCVSLDIEFHLDKWPEICDFSKAESENIF